MTIWRVQWRETLTGMGINVETTHHRDYIRRDSATRQVKQLGKRNITAYLYQMETTP